MPVEITRELERDAPLIGAEPRGKVGSAASAFKLARTTRAVAASAAGALSLLATGAAAQQAAATMYRYAYFAGPAVYVDANRPDMG